MTLKLAPASFFELGLCNYQLRAPMIKHSPSGVPGNFPADVALVPALISSHLRNRRIRGVPARIRCRPRGFMDVFWFPMRLVGATTESHSSVGNFRKLCTSQATRATSKAITYYFTAPKKQIKTRFDGKFRSLLGPEELYISPANRFEIGLHFIFHR